MGDPLGSIWDGERTRFAVHSRFATTLHLCFFDHPESGLETRRVQLKRGPDDIWRVTLKDAPPGTLYGLRAEGPWQPRRGHLFNPAKLLVDPMARAVTGEVREASANYGFNSRSGKDSRLSYNGENSAPFMPKCVVVDPSFDWQGVQPPRIPWKETVIYEAHVRGLTRLHPDVPQEVRGTYRGLCASPMIEHFKKLGITAVELLPVTQIASEPHLADKKLSNYWGYSPLAFCAPNAHYATARDGSQVKEFKFMVRELHRAGIEVLLDVVYNHTAEGGHGGPTLSLRGLDHSTYYRLHPYSGAHLDVTGCGNTLDVGEEAVRRLILESLRYWVTEMHVDGFRFDLGPVFGREHGPYDRDSTLFRALAADPILSKVKLIAEPWDVGPGGYQLGNFPPGWAEWNDRYRDAARRFWHGQPGTWEVGSAGDLAWRMAGSADLFDEPGRGPLAGISFVACHDGFTLHDTVSYDTKHNEANREDNRDGHNHNLSCNWGTEGVSDDPEIRANRARAKRNLLATLTLSQGVPMLLHGDEIGRTQQGNNNAYCQDNAISWIDWNLGDEERSFFDFTCRSLALRRRFSTLRCESFEQLAATMRFAPDGNEISPDTWQTIRAFAVLLRPEATDSAPASHSVDAELLLLINGLFEPTVFNLPPLHSSKIETRWNVALDTASPGREEQELAAPWTVEPFSILVLQSVLSSST